ncbi:MAG: hypothetical protein B0D84_01795, partial [Candidatus Sedimenticola endophacoides]
VRIDPATGKRAPISQKDAIFEVFRADNAPQESVTTGGGDPYRADSGTDSATPPPAAELF